MRHLILALIVALAVSPLLPVAAQSLTPEQLLAAAEQAKANAGALQGQAVTAQATANTLSNQAQAEQAKADALIAQAKQLRADQALAAATEASQHTAQATALYSQAEAAAASAQQYTAAAGAAYADAGRYFQQYVTAALAATMTAQADAIRWQAEAAQARRQLDQQAVSVSARDAQIASLTATNQATVGDMTFLQLAVLGAILLCLALLVALLAVVRFKLLRVYVQQPNFAEVTPTPVPAEQGRGVVVLRPDLFVDFNAQLDRNRIYE